MKKSNSVTGTVAGVVALCGLFQSLLLAGATPASLVEQSGLSGGIVVALEINEGKSIAALAVNNHFLVQGLLTSGAGVEKARSEIKQQGRYGRVSCDLYNGRDLPYIDNLVNVVVSGVGCRVSEAEIMRVLVPGGVLLVNREGRWKKTVKPVPEGTDEWNQFLHGADNNGVSLDDVGPPQRLRWHDAPEFGRSKALSPSFTSMVSADGLVFTIEDRATTEDVNAPVEYYLVARDAYNGIQLWKRPMKQWDKWQTNSIKSIPTSLQRCLAAVRKHVYCCTEFGGPVRALVARTGAERRTYRNTEKTSEFAIDGGILYGLKRTTADGDVELYALDLRKDTMLWSKAIKTGYTGGTMAVSGRRLVYHSQSGLTCVDSASGRSLWTEPVAVRKSPAGKKQAARPKGRKKKPVRDPSVFTSNEHPTVVLTDDMVYCGIGASMVAKKLEDGKTLWTAVGANNYMKSPDLFVADGLVWSRDLKGRDPGTGRVVRQLRQEVTGPMSHDRCYRNRITHRYYLNSASGGTDFLKLDGKAESPNPWARSTCGLAVMPANDMMYNGPYVCQCAIGAMATGLNALYNGTGNSDKRFTVTPTPHLVKGPAFGDPSGSPATAADPSSLRYDAASWPTYRYSSLRSAVTSIRTPETLAPKWKVDIGSHPTAPVVAGDQVYVADRDGHTLYALERESGKTRWTFTAGGRIDSPPTYTRGLVLLGSRGGWVYCLRASDGRLAWKFNGMPERRMICDTGQLESAWPVNGSVMVVKETAYFAAGRNSFLDGGIGLFGLDPVSGKMKYGRVLQGPYQDDRRNFPIQAGGTFQMEGFRSGIFSSAGNELYIRHQAFRLDLEPIKPDNVKTLHLMASPGFLNDSPQHRTYWTVDRNLRYGGPTGKFDSGPAGDAIAFDGKQFYEIRGYPPGRNLEGRGRGMNPLKIYSVFSGRLAGAGQAVKRSAIPAVGNWEKRWNTPVPFAGHAIAVSQNTLLAAGVPMLEGYSQEDTNASYAGEKGGMAWMLNTESGKKLQELRFGAAPVWDGIAIAHNSYFVCLKDGSVVCLSGE